MKENNNIYKQRAINQWTKNPIGAENTVCYEGTLEFFNEIAKDRYNVYAPWMKNTFKFERFRDKKILEIGVGTGTDHLQFAKAGAILTGIDITPKSIELTKKNLELHGYKSNLLIADAEKLPFQDGTFDVVYSFGVLHHIPDTQKAINEIYRVLRCDGGKTIIALYHKNSLYYWCGIFLNRILFKKQIFKNSREEILSEIECGGKGTKPLVKLYTRRDARKLFKRFNKMKIYTKHIGIGTSNRPINKILKTPGINKIFELLSLRFGWYLIIEAKK